MFGTEDLQIADFLPFANLKFREGFEMFLDWDGNGRRDDLFDDYMAYKAFEDITSSENHNNIGRDCCGACCQYMLLVPAV